jgi:hypothetical protein
MHITTKVASSNPEVYSIQLYMIKFVSDLPVGLCFSPISFSSKTDNQDITELLLKVALATITPL